MRTDVRIITTPTLCHCDEFGRVKRALEAATTRIPTGAEPGSWAEREKWERIARLIEAWGLGAPEGEEDR